MLRTQSVVSSSALPALSAAANSRRMAANFELQKHASLHKHAAAIMLSLYPDGHLQERLLGGVWFLARYGEALPSLLVDHAAQECPGHRVIFL